MNANTDKDIKAIANGASLSLGAPGNSIVNIRFNSNLIPKGGSVKFELTGTKTHTYADNAAPYALFGDDGRGNYYYGGSSIPAGKYFLKATPYSGKRGKGKAGTPVSVNFTVTQ